MTSSSKPPGSKSSGDTAARGKATAEKATGQKAPQEKSPRGRSSGTRPAPEPPTRETKASAAPKEAASKEIAPKEAARASRPVGSVAQAVKPSGSSPRAPEQKSPEKTKTAAAQSTSSAVLRDPPTSAPNPRAAPATKVPAASVKKERPAASVKEKAEREMYALERAVETFEQSFMAAGRGAVAVNRKLMDIAQENLNSSLELARDLAGARSPIEIVRLHMSYWHGLFGAVENQARELRALSAEAVTKTADPVRAHMRND
jgi:hypothetical protein